MILSLSRLPKLLFEKSIQIMKGAKFLEYGSIHPWSSLRNVEFFIYSNAIGLCSFVSTDKAIKVDGF